MAHTPGPWKVGVRRADSVTITGPDDDLTYIATLMDRPGWGSLVDNANLLVASPNLLAACKILLDAAYDTEASGVPCITLEAAIEAGQAAIAKAEPATPSAPERPRQGEG